MRNQPQLQESDLFGVQCGHCGGNVFMATCNHFRGTGHEWVMASLCMICRATHWVDGGCPQCKEGGT
jgi:hypothetical protein